MKHHIILLNDLLNDVVTKLNVLTDYINDNGTNEYLDDHRKDLVQIVKQLDKILN